MNHPPKELLPPAEIPAIIQKMLAEATTRLLPVLHKQFGLQFDYSEHSLAVLDQVISGCWSSPPKKLDNLVAVFGSYLGETIRRQAGGQWAKDDSGYYLVKVGIPNVCGTEDIDQRIDPFAKMRKRFLNGSEDSLSVYFTSIQVFTAALLKKRGISG